MYAPIESSHRRLQTTLPARSNFKMKDEHDRFCWRMKASDRMRRETKKRLEVDANTACREVTGGTPGRVLSLCLPVPDG